MVRIARVLSGALLTAGLFAATTAPASAGPTVRPEPSVTIAARGWGDQRDPALAFASVNALTDPAAGSGVGVALIDSGVTASFAAAHPRVVVGPDMTGGGDPTDRFGHGTFMASLIVGGIGASSPVRGIAPGATLVSVKAAGADGSTDLVTLLDSVRWVVEHRAEHNIRVLVLAVAIEGAGDYTASPLSAVLEAAWASGVVVVVPAGNLGSAGLTHPGDDPWLVTVGASDANGTADPSDDFVTSWSGRQSGADPRPDLVAPGRSVVGARAPGTALDRAHPNARLGRGLFVGSGTSMAAAAVGAGAAVVVQHHPLATPDDVKGALRDSARPITGGGLLDVTAAVGATASPDWVQHHEIAFGGLGGTLESMPWAGVSWTGVSWTGVSWTGVSWTGVSWTGVSWTGVSWTGVSWTGVSWTGVSWTGVSWTGLTWSGA